MAGPVVPRRFLERPKIFIPFRAMTAQTFEASSTARCIKVSHGDRQAGGLDAVGDGVIWHQSRIASHRSQRLDTCAAARPLANSRIMRHPIDAVVAALVEPLTVMFGRVSVRFVVVYCANGAALHLEAPKGSRIIDAHIPECAGALQLRSKKSRAGKKTGPESGAPITTIRCRSICHLRFT
jgi:hypothetical protein